MPKYKVQFTPEAAPLILDSMGAVEAALRLYSLLWCEPIPAAPALHRAGSCAPLLRFLVVDVPPYFIHPKHERGITHALHSTAQTIGEGLHYMSLQNIDRSTPEEEAALTAQFATIHEAEYEAEKADILQSGWYEEAEGVGVSLKQTRFFKP